jgi:hypothetical protein
VNTVLHSSIVLIMILLAALGAYVVRALWATFQTISEQRSHPSPATPVLLTAGAVATMAGLAYLVYLSQVTGAA